MPVATRRQLLEAGVHFGHQTRRWNPKMGRYIFGERSGIYIVDLERTLAGLEEAYAFVRDIVARGGTVLFVGTKKQAQDVVAEQATRVGMPYVNNRWLGGMLTNFQTIHSRLRRLHELRRMEESGAFDFLPKKEVLKLRREKEKLERNMGGIQGMESRPEAIFVIDTLKEHIAVTEANKLGIPVIAIVDTNCDPDEVDYVIPGNDDAIRSVSLVAQVIGDAVEEGRHVAAQRMVDRAAEAGTTLSEAAEAGSPVSRPAADEVVPETGPAPEPAAPGPDGGAGEEAPAGRPATTPDEAPVPSSEAHPPAGPATQAEEPAGEPDIVAEEEVASAEAGPPEPEPARERQETKES